MNFIEKVKAFHKTFGAPISDEPGIPKDRADLRVSLLQEELDELKEAIKQNDKVEAADALCDLMYVLCGTILEFGMQDVFNDMFNEVHRSNMSKADVTIRDAQVTTKMYGNKDVYIDSAQANPFCILYVTKRAKDDKILKSYLYSPANLKKFL